MKALAFFGAFNPPTLAHLNLAEYAMKETGVSSVVFVPSKSEYIRNDQGKDFAFSDSDRLKMLEEAAAVRPWLRISDWEIRQKTQSRTYHTLCHLREEGFQPSLLIGSDKLPELENGWLYVKEISEEFGIVCLRRGQDPDNLLNTPFLSSLNIRILETPAETRSTSSTQVRNCLKEMRLLHQKLKSSVSPEILAFLEEQIKVPS